MRRNSASYCCFIWLSSRCTSLTVWGGRNWYGKHGGETGAGGSRPSAAARARVAARGQKGGRQGLRHRAVSPSGPRGYAAPRGGAADDSRKGRGGGRGGGGGGRGGGGGGG